MVKTGLEQGNEAGYLLESQVKDLLVSSLNGKSDRLLLKEGGWPLKESAKEEALKVVQHLTPNPFDNAVWK